MKEKDHQNHWIYGIGSQQEMNNPIWIIMGLQRRDRKDSQILNNDTFCRLPVTSAQ